MSRLNKSPNSASRKRFRVWYKQTMDRVLIQERHNSIEDAPMAVQQGMTVNGERVRLSKNKGE